MVHPEANVQQGVEELAESQYCRKNGGIGRGTVGEKAAMFVRARNVLVL
jgi:hypothetical protein